MTSLPTEDEAHNDNNSLTENGSAADEKSHTFRKRRLSLTSSRQCDGSTTSSAAQEEQNAGWDLQRQQDPQQPPSSANSFEDEKAHSFRKRRLSLTNKQQAEDPPLNSEVAISTIDAAISTVDPPNHKRRRRASDGSLSSLDSSSHNHQNKRLKSRTVHAAELLANPPPTSPSRQAVLPKLYQQSGPPHIRPSLLDAHQDGAPAPKWKKRHTRQLHEDERSLPFPRDIVGTFSCHGVEPIYDSDYRPEDEEEGAADTWVVDGEEDGVEKPTTAAKINQDRGGVAFPYGNCARTALFAVYDGHGQGGELVAQFALHEVQRRLEKHADFTNNIEKAFKQTFLGVDASLNEEVLIEPLYAGTTACVALLRDNKLVLANAGDSRAVLARKKNKGDGWEALDLTKDQNPDLPAEQARIEDMGGYVSPPPEPGLSARVWLDMDCTQIGLAMSRSIGDHAVKKIGVIAEPVVSYHDITADDDFVIFATDGVWEFVTSEEAVRVVSENMNRGATRACQALIEAAAAKWHDEEGDYRDDITALVVRLQHLWKSDHAKQWLQQKPC